MKRVHNFNPGPAALPLPALERAQAELLDFAGTGMSILEHSHRGPVYDAVHEEAHSLVRELLSIPEDYDILFLQGGATQQFAQVPLNLRKPGQSADYVVDGVWGKKAFAEGKQTGAARLAASSEEADGKFYRVCREDELELDDDAAFVHVTTNNTVMGTQLRRLPKTGAVPLVVDASSDIMGVPIDVSAASLIYAGAQKNLGPSGVTLVIAKRSLIDAGRDDIPFVWQYRTQRDARSLANTAPTFAIYMLRNVLAWVKERGGLAWAVAQNQQKADRLYGVLEARPDFYRLPVQEGSRSVMNVTFNLGSKEADMACVKAATEAGFVGLKGHRITGGLRASLYNAVSLESVDALANFLSEYQA